MQIPFGRGVDTRNGTNTVFPCGIVGIFGGCGKLTVNNSSLQVKVQKDGIETISQ